MRAITPEQESAYVAAGIDFCFLRPGVRVSDPAACRRFLHYMADVVDLNQHDIHLPLLPQAALDVAIAVMRLGALPAIGEEDLARIVSASVERFNGRPYNAEILIGWFYELAAALTPAEGR